VTIADVADDILTGPYDQALRDKLRRQLVALDVMLELGQTLSGLPDAEPATIDTIRISTADGTDVQVLTPVNVLDRDKQLGVVKELTEIVAAAAGDASYGERTWVLITESPEGGWGIAGHANTNADIAAAARAALAAD
jgi:phenylpyruvate tautomerase PptA (4-oxalocrotonate tautomerase family)